MNWLKRFWCQTIRKHPPTVDDCSCEMATAADLRTTFTMSCPKCEITWEESETEKL